jgi:hypothetical protein
MSEMMGITLILGLLVFHAIYVAFTESRKPRVMTAHEMRMQSLLDSLTKAKRSSLIIEHASLNSIGCNA